MTMATPVRGETGAPAPGRPGGAARPDNPRTASARRHFPRPGPALDGAPPQGQARQATRTETTGPGGEPPAGRVTVANTGGSTP